MDNSTTRPWSDLLVELLSAIANYLTRNQNYLDIRSFRSVCHSWRSSCPPFSHLSILSPFLPLEVDRPSCLLSSPSRRFSTGSILSVTIVYALHPPPLLGSMILPYTWVVFVDEFESVKLRIRCPFLDESFLLPLFSSKTVNLFDFHVRELGRFYNLSYRLYYSDRFCFRQSKPQFRSENILKVVLFSDGSAAVVLSRGGKLGLIKLEYGDYEEEWDVIHDGKGFRFDDIVDFKGRVLGVDRRGRLYEISHSPLEVNPIVRSIADGDGRRNRLVESLELLYLVVKCSGTAGAFKVYELNEKRNKWVNISSIGDRVFLFGLDFSLSASRRELWFHKNCILFKQHSFRSYNGEVDDKDVFCNSQWGGLRVGVCHLDADTYVGATELYPCYSETLWPPPAWFWPTSRLERVNAIEATTDELLVMIPEDYETKFQDLIPIEDFRRRVCLANRRNAQRMKKIMMMAREIEHKLEASTIHLLYQMERSRVPEQTSLRTAERLGDNHDEPDRVEYDFYHGYLWRVLYDGVTLNSHIFYSEYLVSEAICWQNVVGIGVPQRIKEIGRI